MKFNSKAQDIIACVLFLFFVPILAHLLFSWMGFCPTDDGVNLAFSRRLLEGQIPHRDFINGRPIGSALLHLPFVAFGGDYTFWISRLFVWFEFGCIAWAWTVGILKLLQIELAALQKFMLALIAFMLTTHLNAIMAWYTTDALFFLSLGLALYIKGTSQSKFSAYVLMGASYLCKQSFLPVIPMYLFVLGDWRKLRYWLAAAIPGIVYFIYLSIAGALPDAFLQLCTHGNNFIPRGITTYLHFYSVPWGIEFGYIAMMLSFGKISLGILENKVNLQKFLGAMMLYSVPLAFSIALSQSIHALLILCFGLFGTALGATFYFILEREKQTNIVQTGMLVLLIGWSVSLSNGYNNPALAAGPLTVLLFAYVHVAYKSVDKKNALRKFPLYLFMVLFTVSLFSFWIGRRKYIFEDRPANELTKALDGVLPGGHLIKTNENTYEFLVDFKDAVEKTKGLDFAVIPGLSAYWVKSPKKNPLPIDWILVWGEMNNKRALVDRVLQCLKLHHGKIIVILQKVTADTLSKGFFSVQSGPIQYYVRSHFTKTDETRFFELYQ